MKKIREFEATVWGTYPLLRHAFNTRDESTEFQVSKKNDNNYLS